MRKLVRVVLLGVVLAVAWAVPRAQQPVFRTSTQLVRVDAVVTDADGNPVTGLTADDFELYDRGARRPISTFAEIHHEPRTTPVPPGHTDVASNVVDDGSQLMILVLDDMHVRTEWTEQARAIAKDFVSSLSDGVTMALLSTSGKVKVELTTDRQRILDALDQFGGHESPLAYIAPGGQPAVVARAPGLSAAESAQWHISAPSFSGPRDFDWGGIVQSRNGTLVGVPLDSDGVFKLLESASRMLGSDDRQHKAFAWISTGLPAGMNGFQQALDAMRQAGVATYAIDPTGTHHVIAGGSYDGTKRAGCVPDPPGCPTPWDVSATVRHTTLTTTARASGGIAVVGDDDLAAGVRRIVRDFDEYYILGFSPEDAATPGARPLAVRVTRPGLTVRARPSYAITPPPPKAADALDRLVGDLVPTSNLPLRMYAAALPPASGVNAARVLISLEVSAPPSALRNATGQTGDTLTYGVYAVNLHGGKVVNSTKSEATFTLQPTAFGAPDTARYLIQTALTLPPGQYQLRASARSARTGEDGSVYVLVDVPSFVGSPLALGDIVLGDAREPAAASANYRAASGAHALGFTPTLDRDFARTDVLRVYTEVAAGKATSGVDVTLSFVAPDGRVAWRASHPLGPDGRLNAAVPLAPLVPGAYALRVGATAGANHVQREIAVRIR